MLRILANGGARTQVLVSCVCCLAPSGLVNIYEVMSSFSRVAIKSGFVLFSPKLGIVGFLISASTVV